MAFRFCKRFTVGRCCDFGNASQMKSQLAVGDETNEGKTFILWKSLCTVH